MENVIFSTKAEKELLSAWASYEEQQPGLGDRFVNEIHRKITFLRVIHFIILLKAGIMK